MLNYREFWTDEHKGDDLRWVSASNPEHVISRLGIDLDGVESVLEVGPGRMRLADYLTSLGKRVVVYDIAPLFDRRYVADLPLDEPVDLAVAHLVLQHVPAVDHHDLVRNVVASLTPGGRFHFDAITEHYAAINSDLVQEFAAGLSCPFTAWDLVTSHKEVEPGYFFCVVQA